MENYKILETIGEGAFGVVYLVVDKRDKKEYALKAIDIELAEEQDVYLEDIIREIDILNKLSKSCSRYITCYHDSFRHFLDDRDVVIIVSEYFPGKSFAEYVADNAGNILEDEMWDIVEQLIDGIYYIHSNNIAHRDINKDNILIDDNYNIKFVDFGLACQNKDCDEPASVMRFKQQPPEKFMNNRDENLIQAQADDIWAIGLIIYELIYGEDVYPFTIEDKNDDVLPYSVIVENIKRGFPIYYEYDNNITTLVSHLLDIDQTTRFTAKQAYDFVKQFRI